MSRQQLQAAPKRPRRKCRPPGPSSRSAIPKRGVPSDILDRQPRHSRHPRMHGAVGPAPGHGTQSRQMVPSSCPPSEPLLPLAAPGSTEAKSKALPQLQQRVRPWPRFRGEVSPRSLGSSSLGSSSPSSSWSPASSSRAAFLGRFDPLGPLEEEAGAAPLEGEPERFPAPPPSFLPRPPAPFFGPRPRVDPRPKAQKTSTPAAARRRPQKPGPLQRNQRIIARRAAPPPAHRKPGEPSVPTSPSLGDRLSRRVPEESTCCLWGEGFTWGG